MPTYSYACKDCGHAFDIQQAFSDDALTTCPTCGGDLRKVFSAVGVVFKGSGFYRTDSRGGSGKTGDSSTPTSTPAAKPAAAASEPKTSETKASETKASSSTSGGTTGGSSTGSA